MRITHVAICPTEASQSAGKPALTPELLAATGARYSRNNEGLDAILAKIDPQNLDKSVDGIFRMIDYGHRSIADMVPVSIFIDGISIWLAYYIWSICPTASGQESSTRYIKISADGLISPDVLGIREDVGDWSSRMSDLFKAYDASVQYWESVVQMSPDVLRIPKTLTDDQSDKSKMQIARMTRNYVFDRARYFLPVAAATNLMLLMSARGWVDLCQHLLSHPLKEAVLCGQGILRELALVSPRMLQHAVAKDYMAEGLQDDLRWTVKLANSTRALHLEDPSLEPDADAQAFVCVATPPDVTEREVSEALRSHENRYAWTGAALRRCSVRFGWNAVSIAELRDLNRHRTGTKFCPAVPKGFYCAADQMPTEEATLELCNLTRATKAGVNATMAARSLLCRGKAEYVYHLPLGAQFSFEHLTTGDKFIYEAELRTGSGAHFRYAKHLRDALAEWYSIFPGTRGLVIEGSSEPE